MYSVNENDGVVHLGMYLTSPVFDDVTIQVKIRGNDNTAEGT